MTAKNWTIRVEYIGKTLYQATCPEFPDCHAVADSEDAARQQVEQAIRERLLKHPDAAPQAEHRG